MVPVRAAPVDDGQARVGPRLLACGPSAGRNPDAAGDDLLAGVGFQALALDLEGAVAQDGPLLGGLLFQSQSTTSVLVVLVPVPSWTHLPGRYREMIGPVRPRVQGRL